MEEQLERLETMRAEAMALLWPLTQLNGNLKSQYNAAVRHHRSLCGNVCEYKITLIEMGDAGAPDFAAEVSAWADQHLQALGKIFELIKHVRETNGSWLSGWEAPKGFEYIRPI